MSTNPLKNKIKKKVSKLLVLAQHLEHAIILHAFQVQVCMYIDRYIYIYININIYIYIYAADVAGGPSWEAVISEASVRVLMCRLALHATLPNEAS